MPTASIQPSIEPGDKLYDENWDGVSTVLSVSDDGTVRFETSSGGINTGPEEGLLEAKHIHHWPRDRGVESGERGSSLALDIAANVDGVGEQTAENLIRACTVPEISLGAKEAHRHGQTERFEQADGIGPSTAKQIAEWLLRDR